MIVVTGGAGFIGSNVVQALATSGHRVVVVDWFRTDGRWRNLEGLALHDVIVPERLFPWLAQHQDSISGIVHMGAVSATTERDVDVIVQNNIRMTIDLWEFAAYAAVPFIYASSAATYGNGDLGFSDDNTLEDYLKLRPLNPYGWSKHLIDLRILSDVRVDKRQPPVWAGLKFFNVYGPREAHKGAMRSVVHQMFPRIAAGEPVKLFASDNPAYPDGGQLRDFICVDDCVAVVLSALAKPRLSGIYNVGTGVARSFRDLALAMYASMGQAPNIVFVPMPEELRGRYQYFTQAQTNRVRAHIIDRPFLTLEEGVDRYVNWLTSKDGF